MQKEHVSPSSSSRVSYREMLFLFRRRRCFPGRNRALLLVRTSLVLVIDGDLLVQSALRAKLATGGPDWARMLSEAQVILGGAVPSAAVQ